MQVDSCNAESLRGDASSSPWNKLLAGQVREYAELLKDSEAKIKQLTQQLKEQESREAEMNATFTKASRDMERFKTSFNFRLNLEKSRVQLLRKEHFAKFDAANVDIPAEVQALKELLASQDTEIKDLRALVENNPILAERHAKVLQLENHLKRMAPPQPSDDVLMNKVLEHVEQVMRALEEHKTNLAFLECEMSQKQLQSAGELDGAENDVRMEGDQEMLHSASR